MTWTTILDEMGFNGTEARIMYLQESARDHWELAKTMKHFYFESYKKHSELARNLYKQARIEMGIED